MSHQIETTELTELYINPQIIARGSEKSLSKIKEGLPLFFTVSISDFKKLLSKAIQKDQGHKFENCKAFLIPNSYIELHVEDTISFLDEVITLQVRQRPDGRGINFFASKATRDLSHELSFQSCLPEKEIFFNELHLKTKLFKDALCVSIDPV